MCNRLSGAAALVEAYGSMRVPIPRGRQQPSPPDPGPHAPQQALSDTGFCSRREADGLIAEGRVTVNGLRARVGADVGETDEVRIDGQAVKARKAAKGPAKACLHRAEQAGRLTCTTESSVKAISSISSA